MGSCDLTIQQRKMKIFFLILVLIARYHALDQITPSVGSSCSRSQVCATKLSCNYWEEKESSVKNLPNYKTTSQFKQYLREAKNAICNRAERALCCPVNNDVDIRAIDNDIDSPSHIPQAGECGGSPDASSIFGGEFTKAGEFPFAALLGYTSQRRSLYVINGKLPLVNYTEWVCGGTLVNLWYVVTAGHCVSRRHGISMVRLGEWNVLDDKYGRPATPGLPDIQDFQISKSDIIVHEGYRMKRGNIKDDIALIRLPRKVVTNPLTQIACLPLPGNSSFAGLKRNWEEDSIGERATVIGWGYSCYEDGTRAFCPKQGDVASKKQRKLVVPILDNSKCSSKGFRVTDDQICAGGEFGKSACRGDSGGGLFINDPVRDESFHRIEPWYLFGIVSFGGSNCEASIP